MAGPRENKAFAKAIFPTWPLDDAIGWIQSNMEPEDVFDTKQLSQWAIDNGFVEE